jgi:hypothetical protein
LCMALSTSSHNGGCLSMVCICMSQVCVCGVIGFRSFFKIIFGLGFLFLRFVGDPNPFDAVGSTSRPLNSKPPTLCLGWPHLPNPRTRPIRGQPIKNFVGAASTRSFSFVTFASLGYSCRE